jgi:hypothetical protein
VLLGKHDQLKAERAAEQAAHEAKRLRNELDARVVSVGLLAARLRFLKRAMIVDRYRCALTLRRRR